MQRHEKNTHTHTGMCVRENKDAERLLAERRISAGPAATLPPIQPPARWLGSLSEERHVKRCDRADAKALSFTLQPSLRRVGESSRSRFPRRRSGLFPGAEPQRRKHTRSTPPCRRREAAPLSQVLKSATMLTFSCWNV